MPEHIRALIVLLFLLAVAWVVSRQIFSRAVETNYIDKLFFAGIAVTISMFVLQNIWIFFVSLAIIAFVTARQTKYVLGLFLFLILLIPEFNIKVPGFGLINYFLTLNPLRVLALILLIPLTISYVRQHEYPAPGKLTGDKLVLLFAIYTAVLVYLHENTFTGLLRNFAEATLDFILLYFVASRCLTSKESVRHVVVAFIVAAVFLSLVAIFEFIKHWLLYSGLNDAMGSLNAMFGYLGRGSTLRASATTGQPIVLGYLIMLAFLLNFYAHRLIASSSLRAMLWIILVLGLVAAMSRGPWVGALVGLFVIALYSSKPAQNISKLAVGGIVGFGAMLLLPGGNKILDYLPWVGSIDASNVIYRELLWEQSLIVIKNSIWIGSINFVESPHFDVVRQGGGFVDIVNSYLGLVLEKGVIGLSIYLILLFVALAPVYKLIKKIKSSHYELYLYAVALLGAITASMVTLSTVSSIGHVRPLSTLLLGAGVACGLFAFNNLATRYQN